MKDLITVIRNIFEKDWTISKLFIKGSLDGYSVEDEIRDVKVHGETAISYGRYKLGLRNSPKFSKFFLYSDSQNILIEAKDKVKYPLIKDFVNHDLIWVLDVPNFEYVLIHWGNTDDDTDGCLIVGSSIGVVNGQQGVIGSKAYYKKFYCKVIKEIKLGNQFINYTKQL